MEDLNDCNISSVQGAALLSLQQPPTPVQRGRGGQAGLHRDLGWAGAGGVPGQHWLSPQSGHHTELQCLANTDVTTSALRANRFAILYMEDMATNSLFNKRHWIGSMYYARTSVKYLPIWWPWIVLLGQPGGQQVHYWLRFSKNSITPWSVFLQLEALWCFQLHQGLARRSAGVRRWFPGGWGSITGYIFVIKSNYPLECLFRGCLVSPPVVIIIFLRFCRWEKGC